MKLTNEQLLDLYFEKEAFGYKVVTAYDWTRISKTESLEVIAKELQTGRFILFEIDRIYDGFGGYQYFEPQEYSYVKPSLEARWVWKEEDSEDISTEIPEKPEYMK